MGLADDDELRVPFSQAELGDVLGLSTVHINRVISRLRELGLLRWSDGRVDLLDAAGLSRLAEFDPMYLRLERDGCTPAGES